ncbi:MAG: hypothetical protein JWP89_5646 [Schlesneria sp.]|nr:hypothetical protein [Schlesneria sp.]
MWEIDHVDPLWLSLSATSRLRVRTVFAFRSLKIERGTKLSPCCRSAAHPISLLTVGSTLMSELTA